MALAERELSEEYFELEYRSCRILSHEEQLALWRRAKNGDREATELLVKHNLRLVYKVAKAYQLPGQPILDMVQFGAMGILRAIEKFDETYAKSFPAYAYEWIVGHCQRYAAKNQTSLSVSEHITRAYRAVERQRDRINTVSGNPPTDDELLKAGISPSVLAYASRFPRKVLSLDFAYDGGLSLADHIPSAIDVIEDFEGELVKQETRENIQQALGTLTDQERTIVWKRHIEGLTVKATASLTNMTPSNTHRVEKLALKKLRSALGAKFSAVG